MIYCPLQRLGNQAPRSERMNKAVDWLQSAAKDTDGVLKSLSELELGDAQRVEIDGDQIFAMLICYESRSPREFLEAHRQYYDIQYVHTGAEAIALTDLDGLEVQSPYDAQKDAALFEPKSDAPTFPLAAGSVALLFPEDAHTPGLVWERPQRVEKIVVKVAI